MRAGKNWRRTSFWVGSFESTHLLNVNYMGKSNTSHTCPLWRAFTVRFAATVFLLALTIAVPLRAHAFEEGHFASESKLASGTWVKISVEQSGIHQITSSDANNWGLGSDLSKIHVFGSGGAPISERLTDEIADDLPQVPVVRTDGKLLFYAQGPITWANGTTGLDFVEVQHPYSTRAYYFVTNSERFNDIEPQAGTAQLKGNDVTTFTERLFHEQELINPGETGRQMLGEDFRYNSTQSFKFTLDDMVAGSTVLVQTRFAAYAKDSESKLRFQYNGTNLPATDNDNLPANTSSEWHYNISNFTKSFTLGSKDLTYTIDFTGGGTLQLARLDRITVNYQRVMNLGSRASLAFGVRHWENAIYNLSGANEATQVWDVTYPHKPIKLNVSLSGTTARFSPEINEDGQEYIAFNPGGTFPAPAYVAKVQNQNIHGSDTPDMIIITPSQYAEQAEQIAELHRNKDGMRVLVLDNDKVINEFSCGTPDAMAYRMLCKCFYDRGTSEDGHRLQFLLLMGAGSFDNKGTSSNAQQLNYPKLLTWQSNVSNTEGESYTTDDCFVTLNDNSGPSFHLSPKSIAVGRIPAKSVSDAATMVKKIIDYSTKPDYGIWKINFLNVADDGDNATHTTQAEELIGTLRNNGAGDDYIFNRVFLDAFQFVSNGSTVKFPDARVKFYKTLNEGVAWMNYTGHANPNAITNDGLVTHTDMEQNFYYRHLPVFYGATCEIARFDALAISGGERFLLNPNGGCVAIFAPPRLVYMDQNSQLNLAIAGFVFNRDEKGRFLPLGEVIRQGKNSAIRSLNNSKYFLLGDPAMRMALPTHKIVLDKINGEEVDHNALPTFKARQTVTFAGHIEDHTGKQCENFNGVLEGLLLDRVDTVVTNATRIIDNVETEVKYGERSNRLAVIKTTVANGQFEIKATIPTEIMPEIADDQIHNAMLNLYAYNPSDTTEAVGSNGDFIISGTDNTVAGDTEGPVIDFLGLNSNEFADGDNVNESPLVIATLHDDSGINFSSGGIGHSMTLTLDDNITMSDVASYYSANETAQGSAGSINYPLNDLANGHHKLTFKAWDVFNNSSEKTITFNVMPGLKPEIYELTATPNPAHTETRFTLKHNRPDATVNVKIDVCDLMGRLVWTTTQSGRSDMFLSFPITWDLCNSAGTRVPRGIYIYKATISTDGHHEATKAKKLAVTD